MTAATGCLRVHDHFEYGYIDQQPARLKIAVPGHEAEPPQGLKGRARDDVQLDVLNECARDGWELVATHVQHAIAYYRDVFGLTPSWIWEDR
ncbi:MAG: hypothetical protein ACRDPA_25305, partial [Solirubrobacteraceae bacterium]